MSDDVPVPDEVVEAELIAEIERQLAAEEALTGDHLQAVEPTEKPTKPGRHAPFEKGNKYGLGRESTYNAKYADIAKRACAKGMTDLEVADLLDIAESTMWRWKQKHPEFAEAFKLGKKLAHNRVERALFHKAVGYTYETQRVVSGHKVTLRQHLPPDTQAAVFYLKNRRPRKWKDVTRHESGPAGAFDKIDDAAELRKQLTKMAYDLGLIAPGDDAKLIEGTAEEVPVTSEE